jgi:prepilin-type processing-associated H-X9-DG protein
MNDKSPASTRSGAFAIMQHKPQQKRRGFTLVEFLVVAGCALVFVALLTPSLQSARRDARSLQCKNNMKQLGVAMHNYHERMGCFPPGWVSNHPQPNSVFKIGWQTFTLPDVEEGALYSKFNFSVPSANPIKLLQKRIAVYRCPSDVTPDTNPVRSNYGTSNYSGNYGVHAFRTPRRNIKPELLTNWMATRRTKNWPGQRAVPKFTNGIFHWSSCVRIRDITDGTSYTFMVGERSALSGSGIWPGVASNELVNDALTDCAPGNEINGSTRAFSSFHGKGAYFLMCDGRVKFISQNISSKAGKTIREMGTFQKLSARDDGNVAGEF